MRSHSEITGPMLQAAAQVATLKLNRQKFGGIPASDLNNLT